MSASLGALLREYADPSRVPVRQRFFKTGPGDYAEGDVFIGVTVPDLRRVCRACRDATPREAEELLRSAVHEERLLALLLLVDAFSRGTKRNAGASIARISPTRGSSTTGIWSTAPHRPSSAPGFTSAAALR